MARRPRSITAKARAAFLEAVAAGWSVTEAANRAGVARQRFYDLRQADDVFYREWQEADEQGVDAIRDEIRRRAVDGWDEPVYQRGELAGYIHRKSDRLLELEAKRRDPAYRDNPRVDLSLGADTEKPLEVDGARVISLADLNRFAESIGVNIGYGFADGARERLGSSERPALPPGDGGEA